MNEASTIGIVFPGQGAQRPGMGREFHAEHECARRVYEQASDALSLDVAALCFEDEEKLGLTEYAQPAILTTEIAMLSALRERYDLAPCAWAGHSLGEYAALVGAGVLAVGDAVSLVRERGRLMQEAAPLGSGAMLAVIQRDLDAAALAPALDGLVVDIANFNSTDQIVLSGTAADVDEAKVRMKTLAGYERAKCIALRVSAPFHSRLMRVAAERFRPSLEAAAPAWNASAAPCVASNYSGAFHGSDTAALVEAMARQIEAPVQWLANMRALLDRCARVIEIGPGRPLRGFFTSLGVKIDSVTDPTSAAAALGG